MLAEGIDHLYVADHCSTDGTRQVLDRLAEETGRVTVLENSDEFYRQVHWVQLMIDRARDEGYEWIVPSDVDEFWYAQDGRIIADVIADCGTDKLYAPMYLHRDWNTRTAPAKPLPKVAFRLLAGAQITVGNHEVSIQGGRNDVLALREIQYFSREHFIQKTRASAATIGPAERASGVGWHHTHREAMTDEQMEAEWEALWAGGTICDPIPSHLPSASSYLSTGQSTS